MGDPKTVTRPFSSRGLLLKADPALIPPDTYQELTNLLSPVEGALTVRPGNQRLTALNGAFAVNTTGPLHSITHLRTGGTINPLAETVYVGAGITIYAAVGPPPVSGASWAFVPVATGTAQEGLSYPRSRWASDDFAAGKNGTPYKFFACQSAMFKGDGSITSLTTWGIQPPYVPVVPSITGSGVGPAVFTGAEVPYTWVYTYVNGTTLAESNPCPYQVPATAVTPDGHQLRVPCAGTDNPQVSSINVYRAGGSFADGFYRFVGSAANPGGGSAVFFGDWLQDSQIADAALLQTDNDMPVPSTLPHPWQGQVTGYNSPGAAQVGTGTFTLYFTNNFGNPLLVTPGSQLHILCGDNGHSEDCIVVAATANTVTLFLQLAYDQISTFIGVTVAAGHPADIVLSAFDSMFLAGDEANPHVLYKSKNGYPESFGVFDNEAQLTDAINVGSPADAIMALVEYGGGVLCMNTKTLYFVSVSEGAMGIPTRSPALRGLYSRNAWTKVSNQVWYLAYDGIYSYAGGEEVWQSEAIDPLFRGIGIDPYQPIDLRPGLGSVGADMITMACNGTEVFVAYTDVTGLGLRLRYHTVLKRWSIESLGDPSNPGAPQLAQAITAQYVEADTGRYYLVKQDPLNHCGLFLDALGTTDGWVNSGTDGAAIPFFVKPGTLDMPPNTDRLWSDWSLELNNPYESVGVQAYYNFNTAPDPMDQYSIAPGIRRRVPASFHASAGVQAYALQMRFVGLQINPISLYSLTVNYWDLAQNRQGLAFDWDDVGYPNAKTFQYLNIEMDTGGVQALIALQTDGAAQPQIYPITTTPTDRNRILTLTDLLAGRLIRMVITPGPNGRTNYYKHHWQFVEEPADLTFYDSYPWEDGGWPNEKTFRVLNIEVDTNGVTALLQLRTDGVNFGAPIPVLTTQADRNRILTLPDNMIARHVRFLLTATSGTLRHYKHSWDFFREPPYVTFFDSYPITLVDGYSFVKQAWLQYMAAVPLVMTFFDGESNVLFSRSLPPHPNPSRETERFYLPASNGATLNKAKARRFTITSSDGVTPFKIYSDGSRLEFMALGEGQRSAYKQLPLSEAMAVKT